MKAPVLHLLLTHQTPPEVAAMVRGWAICADADSILVAYGGPVQAFQDIAHPHKVLIEHPRLRTRDHQREKQSYLPVFAAAADWLRTRNFQYVHFAEFDHLPLVPDLSERLVERLRSEGADVMGFRVQRIDGTSHPHFLYHSADPRFLAYWEEITCREDPAVILSMFGSGSFWTRTAFDKVAACAEPFPMYLEIFLPTLAHHLGFRVRDFAEQNNYVRNLGDLSGELDRARAAGAWTAHPVKECWKTRSGALFKR